MTRRVLVVDDSATLRKITQSVLCDAGYEVDTACDGAEGFERVQRAPFDLMLVDFVMPRLNGYQLTQAIRSIPSLKELRVVLMSARAEQMGARFMAQTGAVGALSKPFTPDALRALVEGSLPELSRASEPVDPLVSDSDPSPATLRAPPFEAATLKPAGPRSFEEPEMDFLREGDGLSRTAQQRLLRQAAEALEPIAQYFDTGPPPMGDPRDEFFADRLLALGMAPRSESELGADPLLLAGSPSSEPSVPTPFEAARDFRRALVPWLLPLLQDLRDSGQTLDQYSLAERLEVHLAEPALRALAPALASMHRALGPDSALEGSLSLVPLGEVFQLLHLQAQSGLLVVSRARNAGDAEATFAMHQGRIDQAFGRAMGPEYLLGRYLLADELIDPQGLLDAVSMSRSEQKLLGEFMVHRGALEPSSLAQCILKQTHELVYEVLRWPGGRFRFESGRVSAAAKLSRLGVPSEPLVLEGFRRIDEWRLIAEYIPSERVVFAPERAAVNAIGSERLDRDERRVLDAVDGRRTVREVIDALAVNAFDGCKILYRLVRARLVVPVAL